MQEMMLIPNGPVIVSGTRVSDRLTLVNGTVFEICGKRFRFDSVSGRSRTPVKPSVTAQHVGAWRTADRARSLSNRKSSMATVDTPNNGNNENASTTPVQVFGSSRRRSHSTSPDPSGMPKTPKSVLRQPLAMPMYLGIERKQVVFSPRVNVSRISLIGKHSYTQVFGPSSCNDDDPEGIPMQLEMMDDSSGSPGLSCASFNVYLHIL
jgi:hypothetical protein